MMAATSSRKGDPGQGNNGSHTGGWHSGRESGGLLEKGRNFGGLGNYCKTPKITLLVYLRMNLKSFYISLLVVFHISKLISLVINKGGRKKIVFISLSHIN